MSTLPNKPASEPSRDNSTAKPTGHAVLNNGYQVKNWYQHPETGKLQLSAQCFRAFGWNDLRATFLLYRYNQEILPSSTSMAADALARIARRTWEQIVRELRRCIDALHLKGNLHYHAGIESCLAELEKFQWKSILAPAQDYLAPELLVFEDGVCKNPGFPKVHFSPRCKYCDWCGAGKLEIKVAACYNDTLLLHDTYGCDESCLRKMLKRLISLDNTLNLYYGVEPGRPDNPFTIHDDVMTRLMSMPPMSYFPNWEAYETNSAILVQQDRHVPVAPIEFAATTEPIVRRVSRRKES